MFTSNFLSLSIKIKNLTEMKWCHFTSLFYLSPFLMSSVQCSLFSTLLVLLLMPLHDSYRLHHTKTPRTCFLLSEHHSAVHTISLPSLGLLFGEHCACSRELTFCIFVFGAKGTGCKTWGVTSPQITATRTRQTTKL